MAIFKLIAFSNVLRTGSSSISRYLSQLDSSYASIFGNESWSQLCESASSQDPIQAKAEVQEITNRIQGYLQTAGPCTQIPIAEAMVNYKDEDSCQIFVPFVCVSADYGSCKIVKFWIWNFISFNLCGV